MRRQQLAETSKQESTRERELVAGRSTTICKRCFYGYTPCIGDGEMKAGDRRKNKQKKIAAPVHPPKSLRRSSTDSKPDCAMLSFR